MLLILLWILASLTAATAGVWLGEKYGLGLTISVYVAVVVTAQVLANKIVMFGGYTVPGGVIAYSISFLITDAIVEFYDQRKARQAVWGGFFGSILLVILLQFTFAWQEAFPQPHFFPALNMTWRIVAASLVAYLASENYDVWMFAKIREWTDGRWLWLRNTGSTLQSQFIDTVLFIFIAFWGVHAVWPLIIGQYIVKLIIALFDTPFLYILRWLRNREVLPTLGEGEI